MKGAILYILITVLLLAVIFLLMKGCQPSPSHQTDKVEVDSVKISDSVYKNSLLHKVDSLAEIDSIKDQEIHDLNQEVSWYEGTLSKEGDGISGTLKKYDSAKVIHDTVLIVQTCDTLALQVTLAKAEVYGYQSAVDSLISAKDRQFVIKDSISQAWRSAFLHSDTANAFLQGKYNSLYLDYVKTAKNSSLTGKAILPAAIAGLVIGLILKK